MAEEGRRGVGEFKLNIYMNLLNLDCVKGRRFGRRAWVGTGDKMMDVVGVLSRGFGFVFIWFFSVALRRFYYDFRWCWVGGARWLEI